MSSGIDAYHKWLSIPPQDQPPNHYRLLGLGLFESDPDVVAAAADRQMAHVQTYKTGPHSELSQKLLNEISAAKLCLLRPQKKAAYDEQLRKQLAASSNGSLPNGSPPAFAARGPALAGAASGMPFPGYAGGRVAPPPPALPPPVADAPHALLGTMTVLIGAGAVAVLLLIGIIVVLSHRNNRPPVSPVEKSALTNSEAAPAASTSNLGGSTENGSSSPPTTQPPTTVIPTNQPSHPLPPQNPPQVSKPPAATSGQTGTTARLPKTTANGFTGNSFGPPANAEHPANPPKPKTGSEVATTVPPLKHTTGNTSALPDKSPFDTNPPKPGPGKSPAIKPATDPALAGKAAVPDKAAIAAIEARLGNAEVSPADWLDQAHKAVDAAEIYVLLRRALASAAKQGDAATAISTVDELARRFAVNSLEVRSQTFDDLKLHISTPEGWDALANAAAALFEDPAAAAQPAAREHLEELSLTCARQSANLDTIRKITIRIVRARGGAVPAPKPAAPPAPATKEQ